MLGNQRLVPAGKHHLAHRGSDLVEKVFKFRRGQLPDWAFENGLVTEMAHHASQIALVDDIETECYTRLFAEQPPKASLKPPQAVSRVAGLITLRDLGLLVEFYC